MPPCADSSPQQRAAKGRRYERGQHTADAGVAQRAHAVGVELQAVAQPGADAAAGIRQRRLRTQAGACHERDKRRHDDAGGVAIVEASSLAKLAHDLGKDAAVVAKLFHQQADQQAAGGADQHRKKAHVHAQRRGRLLPQQVCALMHEGHKGKGDQGADDAKQRDKHQQLQVLGGSGLWVNHRHAP